MESNEEKIEEISRRLKEARDAYYNLSPIISDQEYDALYDELKRTHPESIQVTSVGAPILQLSVWEKVAHKIPMGSLNKANSSTELEEWANKTQAQSFFITHKIDGSSMELVYESGILTRCVTRGDGNIGEDVTTNVSRVPSVPKKLNSSLSITVRGEIVMLKTMFSDKYAKEYANPRNTAAAKVREKKGDGIACEDLEFLAYWVHNPEAKSATLVDEVEWLKSQGFKTPEFGFGDNLGQIQKIFEETKKKRDSIEYEIDGMVVSVNELKLLEELGSHNMRPKGQIAWKFDAATGVTKVVDIKWQIGLTGRITPVASVEPVNIGGVTITSISLHNISLFKELKLHKGCRVLVSRRNDVIPYVESNLDLGVVNTNEG